MSVNKNIIYSEFKKGRYAYRHVSVISSMYFYIERSRFFWKDILLEIISFATEFYATECVLNLFPAEGLFNLFQCVKRKEVDMFVGSGIRTYAVCESQMLRSEKCVPNHCATRCRHRCRGKTRYQCVSGLTAHTTVSGRHISRVHNVTFVVKVYFFGWNFISRAFTE